MKTQSFRSLEMSKFEISKILASVLSGLERDQLNLSSLAARNKICSMFLDELSKAEELKNVQ